MPRGRGSLGPRRTLQGQANLRGDTDGTATHLVLSPGLLCTKAHWAARLEALADIANISIADCPRHDTMRDIARSILATAPEQIALAGLSMGGDIAYEVIRQAPEEVKLALLDTGCGPIRRSGASRGCAAMSSPGAKARGAAQDELMTPPHAGEDHVPNHRHCRP
jgi:pimeloyl-ACP methyl ester carboxylesterase